MGTLGGAGVFSQSGTGAADARHDGSFGNVQDCGGFCIGKAFHADQEQCFALVFGQCQHAVQQMFELGAVLLRGGRLKLVFQIVQVDMVRMAPQAPPAADVKIAHHTEEPRPQWYRRPAKAPFAQGPFQAVLHKVFRFRLVAGQRYCVAMQRRCLPEQVLGFVGQELFLVDTTDTNACAARIIPSPAKKKFRLLREGKHHHLRGQHRMRPIASGTVNEWRSEMKPISQFAATAFAGTVLFASAALAGPGEDLARTHFNNIATGKVDALKASYSDKAVLEWVGGPLDGVYTGAADIGTVWTKFTGAQGKLKVDVSNVQENANPAGVTVTANVRFSGKNTIPVRYVLTYRSGKLASEVWQIDPKLAK